MPSSTASTWQIACYEISARERVSPILQRRKSQMTLANMPLQLTRACQLSVDGQRAGAARLIRYFGGRRAAPAVLLSTIT